MTPRLVLLDGAPGVGKSTVAALVAERRPLALALDIDAVKHSLGRWGDDPLASGLQARRLALALVARHLEDGYDVVVGQYLARADVVEQLERVAAAHGATFTEVLLDLDAARLRERLSSRRARPDRPEHAVNNRLVGPADAERLVASLDAVLAARPRMVRVDASGSARDVADRVAALLS